MYWNQLGITDPVTEIANNLIQYNDLTCMTMVGVSSGIAYCLFTFYLCSWWSNANKNNEKVEFWWSVLPAGWLALLSYPSLNNLYNIECEASPASETVNVIGHQWYWEYKYSSLNVNRYEQLGEEDESWSSQHGVDWANPQELEFESRILPTDDLQDGEYRLLEVDHRVVLPLGNILMGITSADVIHSWYVPSLGVNIDAVPGNHNVLEYIPTETGVFYGQCAEICGVNHSFIPIVVEIVSEEVFVNWIELFSNLENYKEYLNFIRQLEGLREINDMLQTDFQWNCEDRSSDSGLCSQQEYDNWWESQFGPLPSVNPNW